MGSPIDHSAHYTATPAEVHAAFVDPAYWRMRLAEVGGPGAEIEDASAGDGTIDLTLRQAIAEEHLPSVVTSIRPGDLIIHRTERWERIDGDRARGRFSAGVEGMPGKVEGTLSLTSDETGSTVVTEGSVEVKIPFLGSKIEAMIVDELVGLFDAEQRFTADWLDGSYPG
ncbi:MAG: DUF2505 domain-containing protein [Rhodococcus sp.]|uniref:DUF2505 domain-containing protein n=1 Tax=Rhodococcus sp. TaxID=1831 RepID=UPI0016A9F1D0|nr:DUF2505 domain-containing protein [Rhodococcus sp. (in: high G+C Gram-positive bacteria)]NLV79895.1 DUF2505 domain-containing protein [Rhodococcus sp. (in: high G+C Gram-positive bacteria)]